MAAPKTPDFDPFALLHEWFARSEKTWSENLVALMKDERLSPVLAKQVKAAVHLQTMTSEKMAQYLALVNLPSHSDVQRLEGLVGQLADSVARVEAEIMSLRGMIRQLAKAEGSAPSTPRLRRTLKPRAR
jgi:hypothetical protein